MLDIFLGISVSQCPYRLSIGYVQSKHCVIDVSSNSDGKLGYAKA